MDMKVEFTDNVTGFNTRDDHINVLFAHQPANYRLSPVREDFVEQIAHLAEAWKSGKLVQVVLEGLNILSVKII